MSMGVSHNFFFLEEGVGVVKNVQGKCLTVELIYMEKVMLNASWCVFFFPLSPRQGFSV